MSDSRSFKVIRICEFLFRKQFFLHFFFTKYKLVSAVIIVRHIRYTIRGLNDVDDTVTLSKTKGFVSNSGDFHA